MKSTHLSRVRGEADSQTLRRVSSHLKFLLGVLQRVLVFRMRREGEHLGRHAEEIDVVRDVPLDELRQVLQSIVSTLSARSH